MVNLFINSQGQLIWASLGGLVLACLFFVGGCFRIVEFEGLGLSRFQKRVFSVGHILGCFLFSFVMALLIADAHAQFKLIMNIFFGVGIGILFPIHIFIGLKRRIKIQDRNQSVS